MADAEIHLRVNGVARVGRAEPRRLLADFLREDMGLPGTHLGCEQGACGACTVLLDGKAVRSCLLLAVQADGHEVLTVEGLGAGDVLHPVQQGFHERHAFQCGFCAPGFVLQTLALLTESPDANEETIRRELAGNLCRCTGYAGIVAGACRAAELLREQAGP